MDWLKFFEEIVNTPTGPDLSIQEKLSTLSNVKGVLESWGFNCKYGKGSLIAETGKAPFITLIGHFDTVFKKEDTLSRPFKVVDGKVYGPGVADMKGGIVVMLKAVKEFLDEKPELKKGLRLMINVDEELGSKVSREDMYLAAKDSICCLSYEPARPSGALLSARKGIAGCRIKVYGEKAHAALIGKEGANAVVEISDKILQMFGLIGKIEGLTVNPSIVNGGVKSNIVPDYAEAYFDIRYARKEDLEQIENMIGEICSKSLIKGTKAEYEFNVSRSPMRSSDSLLELVGEVAKTLRIEISFESTGGGGDSAFFSEKGVDALDGLGIVGGSFHSEKEYAELNSLDERSLLSKEILKKLQNS